MNSAQTVANYKLDRKGLARLFGELEAGIMESLWALGEGTVSAVSAHLGAAQQYTTIQTVLNRLSDKGILDRSARQSSAVVYRPIEPRDVFIERTSRQVVASLLADFGTAALSGLVDAVGDLDPRQLDALADAIRARRPTT